MGGWGGCGGGGGEGGGAFLSCAWGGVGVGGGFLGLGLGGLVGAVLCLAVGVGVGGGVGLVGVCVRVVLRLGSVGWVVARVWGGGFFGLVAWRLAVGLPSRCSVS